MTNENRRRNLTLDLAEADRCLKAAEALLGLDLFKDALNRTCYGVYHLCLAVLLTEGIEPKTHRGALSLLGSEFVRTGRLPAQVQHEIARLATYREYADYDRDFVATRELAASELEATGQVRELVRGFLEKGGFTNPEG